MRILDKYILKSFLRPFFATFLIVLFVLIMQMLWQTLENIAGKGVSIGFILKFLYYTTLIMIPQALPIGVLLSSIMALGNLGENYEFAAVKSAGISLQRLVRPIVFLAFLLSAINFLFLNNIYPYAILKQKNLYLNIKKKKPSLALVAGSFNSEIPNYQIKFEEKYGENNNLLKKVLIYDVSSRRGNQKVITAKRGKIISEEGSRYMTLILYDGYFYENHLNNRIDYNHQKRMPASNGSFKEYEFNIDISSLSGGDLEAEKYTKIHNMLSVQQLGDTIPIMKSNYDEFMAIKSKNIYNKVGAKQLYNYPDTLKPKELDAKILNNFNLNNKAEILDDAISKTIRSLINIESNKKFLKIKRKKLNLYDIEYYNRIAFSLSCLILFFIGAPLGSIIRKGGFGLPMVLAIFIYVFYYFGNTFGRNLAEESSVSAFIGSWIAAFVMIPIGFLLTRRATKDMGLFDINTFFAPITNFFKKILSKKIKNI